MTIDLRIAAVEAKEAAERWAKAAEIRARIADAKVEKLTREIEAVESALDEFRGAGTTPGESVAILRARLSELAAEIEGPDGWREREARARAERDAARAGEERVRGVLQRLIDHGARLHDMAYALEQSVGWRCGHSNAPNRGPVQRACNAIRPVIDAARAALASSTDPEGGTRP